MTVNRSGRTSAGCRYATRIRAISVPWPIAGSKDSSNRKSPKSLPYEVEFSLTKTASVTPRPASQATSATTSAGGREMNEPRNEGIAQKVHRRSQPDASFTGATGEFSSLLRRIGGCHAKASSALGITFWEPCQGIGVVLAARSTGLMGNNARRSLGVWAVIFSPRITASRRSPIFG